MAEVNRLPERDPTPGKPKISLPSGGGPPYDSSMEARVAVLEQIAKDTKEILVEMKRDIRELRQDQKSDFRILFAALITATLGLAGMIAGLGVIMAHGFKWF
jgi:hypothetical protein